MSETLTNVEGRTGVAVIGMACRFPGARDLREFWQLLCRGMETLSHFSSEELWAAGVPASLFKDPRYVPVNGLLEDVKSFDAPFFGMSPREASITDPQHRVFLELAWHALEHAGYDPLNVGGPVGVYAGCGPSSYLLRNLWGNRDLLADVGELRARMGNSQEYLATRVSYKLNLTGPSISVNTACSTSLVAVHLACDSLLNYQCDYALAGGISIQVPQTKGYLYEEGGILSPDGHCRAFDAKARGTVSGNGGGVVVLKRLEDALADRDTVYAVILGSAINNDGADKAGYTAPSISGQASVIAEAQTVADVSPDSIQYIETHGTGTPLGDPIEIAALTQAFKGRTDRKGFCAIGSVKTNFGHLDEGAGVAGLLKTVLSLYYQQIPPSLHFELPNPEIDFGAGPFYVNAKLAPWPEPDGGPRRAGVSSFGIGGTNAHVVLEEAPIQRPEPVRRELQLLPLSAQTPDSLFQSALSLVSQLEGNPDLNLADVAYVLQVGRTAFNTRRFFLASSIEEATVALNAALREEDAAASVGETPPVIFTFSGQGSQHVQMARTTYEREPVFRQWMDTCSDVLGKHLKQDLRRLLYPSSREEEAAARELQQTALAQPALFAVEYSLARTWMHWGINPVAMIGHSLGEYVAACLAGVFELEEALALVAVRGRLMQSAPTGAMMAVPLSPSEVEEHLTDGVEIAAVNAPGACVVGGAPEAVLSFEERLHALGTDGRRLNVSHAFHSKLMTPILDDFSAELRRYDARPPRLPYVSNLTGDWIRPDEACDPDYYVRHLRLPVLFARGIESLLRDHPRAILLEVGPGQVLTALSRYNSPADVACLPSLPHPARPEDEARTLLTTLGRLWERGVAVDWHSFAEPGRKRLALPGYSFRRARHWVELRPESPLPEDAAPRELLKESPSIERWEGRCYAPAWEPAHAPRATKPSGHWLLLADGADGDRLAGLLRGSGCRVTIASRGDGFARQSDDKFVLRPDERQDYLSLFESLPDPPSNVILLWSYGLGGGGVIAEDWCHYLLALLQAVETQSSIKTLTIVASGLSAPAADDWLGLEVEKGVLPGFVRSASLEFPDISLRLVDVASGALDTHAEVESLIAICNAQRDELFLSLRGATCWTQEFVPLSVGGGGGLPLRVEGVYLITGGLGGIGTCMAEYLAREWSARLVLLGRTLPPPEEEWPNLLADPLTPSGVRKKLERLRALKESGAEVLLEAADVSHPGQLVAALESARLRFGCLNGVIHAAGLPDGALLSRQTKDGMDAVLAPKLAGTRLLAETLAQEPLDFLLLCSALSAVTGAPGQAAYCAANSFLDHFAFASPYSWPVFAIDWDAWLEVGMAADALAPPTSAARPFGHPLLRWRADNPDGSITYKGRLRTSADWVLAEHRVGGGGLLPGTAYVEMVLAAARNHLGTYALELTEVQLLQPLLLSDEESAEISVILTPSDGAYAFQVTSSRDGGPARIHAEGVVARHDALPATIPFKTPTPSTNGDSAVEGYVSSRLAAFGPRWHCLKGLSGQGGTVAELSLDEEFASEADDYFFHPALMDVATGFPVLGEHYDSALLPFSYGRLRAYAPLPPRLHSELLNVSSTDAGLRLDLRLMDERGKVLAEVEDYLLRRSAHPTLGENFRLVLGEKGRLDSFSLEPCERPAPGPGMVEIEVRATGINFKEVLYAAGMLPEAEGTGWQFGLECAGTVSRLGEGVAGRRVGESVVAYAAGCLRGYAIVPASQVQPLPHGLDFAAGASLPTAFVTALYALEKQARLSRGETVLIHSAAGGVGLAAVQIAKSIGASIIATAGSEAKREYLRELGVEAVFDSRSDAFVQGVREQTQGQGVNVVLNSLSGDLLFKSLECLAPYGRFLELGVRDIHEGQPLNLRHFARAISFHAISVGPGMPGFAELFEEVLGYFRVGRLSPLPHRVFPLSASGDAFEHLAQSRHVGKVVIAVRPDACDSPAAPESGTEFGLTNSDGLSIFKFALGAGLPQLVVSTQDLPKRLEKVRGVKFPGVESSAAPSGARPEMGVAYAAPAGEMEERLAEIFGRLLGVKGVGRDDDFFALGGDSLIGTQLVAQVNRTLGSHLTLRDFLERPTVAAVAARLTNSSAPEPARIPLAPIADDYPLTHAQKRLWLLAQNQEASVAYNMSYKLRLNGALDLEALRRSFNFLVQRHESLRTAFLVKDGEPRQRVLSIPEFELPLRDLSREANPETEVGIECSAEALTPFSLERPPLLHARILRLSEYDHVLLVSMHHVIADGLSLQILTRELHASYEALSSGRVPSLPPLPLQYKDFAVWQHRQLADGHARAQRAYWLDKLAGELPMLNLPTDRARTGFQKFEGGQIVRRLGKSETDALHACCQKRGVTLFTLLVAALKVLLHQATGQDDIIIGTPVAGREQPELEGQIGYYLNNVVLRDTVRRGETFAGLLGRVRDTVAGALAHQSYPFDLLIEELAIETQPGRSPLFDVQINLMPGEAAPLLLGNLAAEGSVVNSRTTLFDLNFMFADGPRGLALEISYGSSLFDPETVGALGERLMRLLGVVASQPDLTVRDLCDLLNERMGAAERGEFLAASLELDEEF